MSQRSKRRAAARKSNKRNALQAKTLAAAASYNPESPAPQPKLPPHLTEADEEDNVELTESYARRRARDLAALPSQTKPEPEARKPISEAQLAANRANARHSTGATTSEGKAASARNNFRHGLTHTEGDLVLIDEESPEEYSQALAEFQNEWQPETATEKDLVERLASRQWLRRRALRLQKLYISSANGQILDYQMHALYYRYETQHQRAYNKALNDLLRLRSLKRREQNGFESQKRKDEEHTYRIQALQNRQKLQELAIRTAEARAQLQEHKLNATVTLKTPPKTDQINPDLREVPSGPLTIQL